MKILGWVLFGYGILGALYSLVTVHHIGLLGMLLACALFILGGWALAHRK